VICFIIKHFYFSTDKIRKRFGCRPKPIRDLVNQIQDVDVKNDQKIYLSEHISGLADATDVTEKLLERLKEENFISQNELNELKTEDDSNRGLALYTILSMGKFALSDLIQLLDDEGQYGPLWILREFYNWVIKKQDSLKIKSVPTSEYEHISTSLPSYSFIVPFPFNLPIPHTFLTKSGSTSQQRSNHSNLKTVASC
jgi:hypothetical protein